MLVSPLQPCSHSIPRKEYSLRTLSESSRLVPPRDGGFLNRRIFAPAVIDKRSRAVQLKLAACRQQRRRHTADSCYPRRWEHDLVSHVA